MLTGNLRHPTQGCKDACAKALTGLIRRFYNENSAQTGA